MLAVAVGIAQKAGAEELDVIDSASHALDRVGDTRCTRGFGSRALDNQVSLDQHRDPAVCR